jgi:hypothetical protein
LICETLTHKFESSEGEIVSKLTVEKYERNNKAGYALIIQRGNDSSYKFQIKVVSHPETPDETLLVSNSETRDFSSWQGNRGLARRRSPSIRRKLSRQRKLTASGCPKGEDQRSESQANPKVDAARAEKNRFRMETK